MKILVIGDRIVDFYRFGHATRICPEGPVPVIVEDTKDYREGGAALVYQQLLQLTDGVHAIYGSQSLKERIFADDRLVCRIDRDGTDVSPDFLDRVIAHLDTFESDTSSQGLVISDYGKGAFTEKIAHTVMEKAVEKNITVFVDAKHTWEWYKWGDYFFPNQHEPVNFSVPYLIQKLGKAGCRVKTQWAYDQTFPLDKVFEARDVTGAGDIFLAAFVSMELPGIENLDVIAKFANRVAAMSVQYLGTRVITREELANVEPVVS